MSGIFDSFSQTSAKEASSPADSFRAQPRPEHHIHRDSEPLPGNGSISVASSQDQVNDSGVLENRRDTGVAEDRQETPGFQDSSFGQNASNSSLGQNASNSSLGQNASNSERSSNVIPTNQSGVSNDGRESGPLPGNNSISGASSQDQIKDPGSESGRDTGVTEVRQETPGLQDSSFGQNASNSSLCQNASNSERSLNVKPTNQSSASVDGRESEPLQGNDSVSGASSQDQIKDPGSESGRDTSVTEDRQETPQFQDSSLGQNSFNSFNSERSLNAQPTNQSSASVDGRESESLPGNDSVSGASSQDQIKDPGSVSRRDTGVSEVRQETPGFQDSSFGQNASNSERSLSAKSTNQSGVSSNGRESEPLQSNDSISATSSQDQAKDSGVSESRRDNGVAEDRQETPGFQDSSFGQNASNSERPLNVKPTSQGGVSIDGREDLPEGHANIADKMIGKIQKVAGKAMKKPELHEKGELRESGGKLAVIGEARAPHD